MRHAPSPAWPPPAPHDFWHTGDKPIDALVVYDRTCHIISSKDKVIFGSSSDDKVYCLDALSGQEVWTFYAEAPIRLAPTVANNAVLFGSDDGTGRLSFSSKNRQFDGNQKGYND